FSENKVHSRAQAQLADEAPRSGVQSYADRSQGEEMRSPCLQQLGDEAPQDVVLESSVARLHCEQDCFRVCYLGTESRYWAVVRGCDSLERDTERQPLLPPRRHGR